VAGFDYQMNYRYRSIYGQFTPSLSVTQTYAYGAQLVPGAPAIDGVSKAQDSSDWSPRWKGTVALGWKRGAFVANVDSRYVGHYLDYDSTTRDIGNFWLYDANLRYGLGQVIAPNEKFLKGAYLEVGGVNLFNQLPKYSDYESNYLGYDPAEADIRGRFLYAKAGVKW